MNFEIRRHVPDCVLLISLLFPAVAVHAGPFDDPGHIPSEMVAWATSVDDFFAGPLDIANPTLGSVTFGLPELVLGPSRTGGVFESFDVVSLGDGGFITLHFDDGIGDGFGNDFAVFENGFLDPESGLLFGEFAFVEVSTNGVDFARFPATSLTLDPVADFGFVDRTNYDNFAGDQPVGVGTGFDLGDLEDDPLVLDGTLDLADVQFVRLVDVIGDGSTVDHLGTPVFDPYATPFPAGGFDAEAIGVLHMAPEPGLVQLISAGVIMLLAAAHSPKRQDLCTARG